MTHGTPLSRRQESWRNWQKNAAQSPYSLLTYTPYARSVAAGAEFFERLTRKFAQPEFGLKHTYIDGVQAENEDKTIKAKKKK